MSERVTKLAYLLAVSVAGLATVIAIQQFQVEKDFALYTYIGRYTAAAYQAVPLPPPPPNKDEAKARDFDTLMEKSVEILNNISPSAANQ